MPIYADETTEARRGDLIVGRLPGADRSVAGIVVEVSSGDAERNLKVAFMQTFEAEMGRSSANLGRWAFRGYEPGEITVQANTSYLPAKDCALLWRKPAPSARA
jgi:hypothetical protein